MVFAGQPSEDKAWEVYVDQNNDKIIQVSEEAFTINKDERQEWENYVDFSYQHEGQTLADSVKFTVGHHSNIPAGYDSSNNPEIPTLVFGLPFKYRSGTTNDHQINVTTPFPYSFKESTRITIDRNQDDTLDVSSGSNENYYAGIWRQKRKYYSHPSFKLGKNFWTIANIDSEGNWIRLRPAYNTEEKKVISKGKLAPAWEATTIKGKK